MPKAIKVNMEQFNEDKATGMSINALASKHGIPWSRAKQLAGGTKPAKKKKPKANKRPRVRIEAPTDEDQVETADDEETGAQGFQLEIMVPEDQVEFLINTLTREELTAAVLAMPEANQALVYQFALQARINSLFDEGKEEANANAEGDEQENSEHEHQGVSHGQDLRTDESEIRESES